MEALKPADNAPIKHIWEKRKGRCKENRAGESKELELSDFITESQI